ncbi:helix-turn-helix domain-containing protein [Saccharopolyspora sp. HNM0986]|uniref:helix-turn-helix domain-containing protein n=1 Tax=Saccharopolyspora galaxeae TaxID=2781241 RepID=UPI0019095EA8|nr:helix-turn-helix domain-containing protein [Saccharopolyspora sp. HNM0986]MBK0870417.1 helix-turn-helix domain-containing protein [Saccharopolyspora sp. HNM0986]
MRSEAGRSETSRHCARCGSKLARDNAAPVCSPCRRAPKNHQEAGPRVGDEFWAEDRLRQALAGKDMGAVVRAYRVHPAHGRKPLPQADVAKWLSITQSQLSRIESGRNRVRELDQLRHYARQLRIPPELLWFDAGDSADEPVPPKHAAVVLPGGPSVPAANVRTEPALAESLLMTLKQYITTDNLVGPRSVLPVAAKQASFANGLLAQSQGQSHRSLLYVAARFAEFTGWLDQDAGKLQEAMAWSNTALDLAHEAEDAHLASYIHMRKSNIASDAHKPALTIDFAQAALRSSETLSPRLKAVALRQEAHGHAMAGDYEGCSRAIDRAFRYAADEPDDESDIARYCTPSYVEMEAAHCWVELGKPVKALATLQQGIANWHADFRRDLGLGLARLAVAHAVADQPEEAVAVARHSLTIATETRSHRTARQLRRTSQLLADAGAHDQASQLSRTLRTTLA